MRSLIRVGLVVALAACSDALLTPTSPTGIRLAPRQAALVDWNVEARIDAQIVALFPRGHARSVAARWESVKRLRGSEAAAAEQHLADLIDWMRKKASEVSPPLGLTREEAVEELIYLMRRWLYGDPDLFFAPGFTLDAAEVVAGASVTTSGWTVTNGGGVESRAFIAQFRLASATGSVALGDAIAHPSIDAGASAGHAGVALTIPAGTAPGSYDMVLVLDADAKVEESDEDNNVARARIVVIDPQPTSGADLVLLMDINLFDQVSMTNAGNIQLVQNLVGFRAGGARRSANSVWVHVGHASGCSPLASCMIVTGKGPTLFETAIVDVGYRYVEGDETITPLASIPAEVKTIFIWRPNAKITDAEAASLKRFIREGGRVVFVGESEITWRFTGIALANDFLTKMGASMRMLGGFTACPGAFMLRQRLARSSMRDHQVTEGISTLWLGCAGILSPSALDTPLLYDEHGVKLVGAIAHVP